MPGYVLHVGAAVECAHKTPSMATPLAANLRVRVSGQATILKNAPYAVANCPFNPGTPSPCLTATWTTAADKVTSMGQPLVLTDSQSLTEPNAVFLDTTRSQTRVKAS
jgi:hypothetical protein